MIKIILPLLVISSCAFMDRENLLVVKNSITGYPQNIVSEELFLQQKFSFAEASFGRGPSAILSLRSIVNDVYKWQSADGIIIYTYNGFILKTEGLDHNIETNNKSLMLDKALVQNINFLNPPIFGIDLNLSIYNESFKTIRKGWLDIETKLVRISKKIPFLKWNKVDKFWINKETNLVERTTQHIHPNLPSITLTFYYKY